MAQVSYHKLLKALDRELISASELLAMSESLAESILPMSAREAHEAIDRFLMEDKGEDCDLDVDALMTEEVDKRVSSFQDQFAGQAHLAEGVWRVRSRRIILDAAWKRVREGTFRPTMNSTEKFDMVSG